MPVSTVGTAQSRASVYRSSNILSYIRVIPGGVCCQVCQGPVWIFGLVSISFREASAQPAPLLSAVRESISYVWSSIDGVFIMRLVAKALRSVMSADLLQTLIQDISVPCPLPVYHHNEHGMAPQPRRPLKRTYAIVGKCGFCKNTDLTMMCESRLGGPDSWV